MQYSIEGTRRFRALKLWLSWKHLGSEGFGRLVEATADLAAYLAQRCRDIEGFEVAPPEPELSVVCFRHVRPGMDPDQADAHQDRLQRALEVSGDAWVSTTRLRGRTYLRAGIVNYLSTEADVDRMLDALVRLSAQV
jgi:glutamate/tyrosine decarboxylase-like PLP-dependent enzyme